MQTENKSIEIIQSTKQIAKSETSKGQGLSTDNDCSQELSIANDQLDLFDCTISVSETEKSSELKEVIQLPTIVSFQSKV